MTTAVPLSRKVLQTGCAIAWCLVAAGPVFGFAALKPVLVAQGVYGNRCAPQELALASPCVEQDLALNKMFTVAAVVTNVAALAVGAVLDKYGPRILGIIGLVLLLAGLLLFATGLSVHAFDPYLAGYSLLALGGPFCFILCFHLANAFPNNLGLVLALLTGAFDSSLALFLVYRVVYTLVREISVHSFFTSYLVVPLFIFACQVTIMPSHTYRTPELPSDLAIADDDEAAPLLARQNSNEVYGVPIPNGKPAGAAAGTLLAGLPGRLLAHGLLMQHYNLASALRRGSNALVVLRALLHPQQYERRFLVMLQTASLVERVEEANLLIKNLGVYGALHGVLLSKQLQSPWFVLMALFTTIQMLRINYFVATVRSQEEFLFNPDVAVTINHFFDAALPIGGLLSIPFIGVLLDNFQTWTVLAILLGTSVAIGVFGLIAQQWCAYAGIALLVVYRPFYYTAVLDFCAKVFGYKTFGTVYGAIICFSGLCNLLQSAMDQWTHETFNMNPGPVNQTLTGLTAVIGLLLLAFIKQQEQTIQRRQLELEAESAVAESVPH